MRSLSLVLILTFGLLTSCGPETRNQGDNINPASNENGFEGGNSGTSPRFTFEASIEDVEISKDNNYSYSFNISDYLEEGITVAATFDTDYANISLSGNTVTYRIRQVKYEELGTNPNLDDLVRMRVTDGNEHDMLHLSFSGIVAIDPSDLPDQEPPAEDDNGDNTGNNTGNNSDPNQDSSGNEDLGSTEICERYAKSQDAVLLSSIKVNRKFPFKDRIGCSISSCYGKQGSKTYRYLGKNYSREDVNFEGEKIYKLCRAFKNESLDDVRLDDSLVISKDISKAELNLTVDASELKMKSTNISGGDYDISILGESEDLDIRIEDIEFSHHENGKVSKLNLDLYIANYDSLKVNTFLSEGIKLIFKRNGEAIGAAAIGLKLIKLDGSIILKDQITLYKKKIFSFGFNNKQTDRVLNKEIQFSKLAKNLKASEYRVISESLVCEAIDKNNRRYGLSVDAINDDAAFRLVEMDNISSFGLRKAGNAKVKIECHAEFINLNTGDITRTSDSNPLKVQFD